MADEEIRDAREPPPIDDFKEGWERDVRKHIFILSSSGKPIYSRYGDEQDIVTTFGLLQAVVSIIRDSGDDIKCIKAGRRRIVYFIRNSLYFVCMSSTGEPECVLCKQLEFMYSQILLVLTSKVHEILRNNSSKDLRDLLGYDTTRLMDSACLSDLCPTSIAFQSVRGFPMEKTLREDILLHLQNCVERSGAALGMILYGDGLVAYSLSPDLPLVLGVSDIMLLAQFVGNSNSLRSHDQNWVPICLPQFNAGAFLQAYVCDMKIISGGSTHCGGHRQAKTLPEFSLVLISASNDANMFRGLHEERANLETALSSPEMSARISRALEDKGKVVTKYLTQTMCLHFLYKLRPLAAAAGGSEPLLPTQFIAPRLEFPVNTSESHSRIWTQYQRLAVCLRRGTSLPECTLLPLQAPSPAGCATDLGLFAAARSGPGNKRPEPAAPAGKLVKQESSRLSALRASAFGSSSTATAESAEAEAKPAPDDSNVLSAAPSPDHSLAYEVLSTRETVVALATSDSEFYATFPGTVTALDACGIASFLSRTLRQDSVHLLQTTLPR